MKIVKNRKRRGVPLVRRAAVTVLTTCFGGLGALCDTSGNDITCRLVDGGLSCRGEIVVPLPSD